NANPASVMTSFKVNAASANIGALRSYHFTRKSSTVLILEDGWKSTTVRADLRKSDRKSTRLNSSHVKISYAVFCLKKKKPYRIHSSYSRTLYIISATKW